MKKTIANVTFTENGILVEKSYAENFEVLASRKIKEEKFTGELLDIAKCLAKARMAHCYHMLHSHLANASHITASTIAWEGGQFQVPVWEALEGVIELDDVRNLEALQAQQLIRSMIFQVHNGWVYDYDANWKKIPNSDIRVTEEFQNFITEHILVVKCNIK